MDGAAYKLLESTTYRALHAQSFARSSSQASGVLTDLLARYMTLLMGTCAKYAHHAGRTNLTLHDALHALEEMGVSLAELSEYGASEARETGRYAANTARRIEDLNEFKAALAEGLPRDRDDAIPLFYGLNPDSEGEESGFEEEDVEMEDATVATNGHNGDLESSQTTAEQSEGLRASPRHKSPPLPLSPVSNPGTPPRKRARTSSYEPQLHIPDFLPPFPKAPEPVSAEVVQSPMSGVASTSQLPPLRIDKLPLHPPSSAIPAPSAPVELQPSTSVSASDYHTPIPYSQSTLASLPEWHLPQVQPPPSVPGSAIQRRPSPLPTPRTQPALIGAYHHILTHPPPRDAPPVANPARHRVAVALLELAERQPRWDPPNTLYAGSAPPAARLPAIGPTFAMPLGAGTVPPSPAERAGGEQNGKEKEREKERERDREKLLPTITARPVVAPERLAPSISQQDSRLPALARHILPPAVQKRTTRLGHPPVLTRGAQKLVYGPAVPAPWNTSAAVGPGAGGGGTTPAAALGPSLANGLRPGVKTEDAGGKDAAAARVLPDARLHATWDYEQKHFWEPLSFGRRVRGAQVQVAGGGTSAGAGGGGSLAGSLARRRESMAATVGSGSRRDSLL